MDESSFDAITRSVGTEAGPRRAMVRLLAGVVLGAIASRLATPERAAAKAASHKGTSKRRHSSSRYLSPPHEGQPSNSHHRPGPGVQSEGKRKKGKKNKRHHSPPPPLPPGCQNCNECQMCQDGVCVPDPDLGGVPCQGSGPTCSHCLNGVCTVNEQLPCSDGICVHRGTCCPGEKWCEDHNSSTGFSCIDPSGCCPRERVCSDGTCGTSTRCCPNERKCPGSGCVPAGACCPSETDAHFCPPTPEYPQGFCCTPPLGVPCPIFVSCAGVNGHDLACNWTSC